MNGWEGIVKGERLSLIHIWLKRSTLPCNLILCCMRGTGNEKENEKTMELAGEYIKKRILPEGKKGYGVVAMDLAGAEALYPTYKYKELFKKAADKEIPFTIHAGEAGGAAEVACAIEMGAARIGHGVRSYEEMCIRDRPYPFKAHGKAGR